MLRLICLIRLRRYRLWFIPLVVLAAFATLTVLAHVSIVPPKVDIRSSAYGVATTTVLLDAPGSLLTNLTRKADPVVARAAILAPTLETAEVRSHIARTAGVPVSSLLVEGSTAPGLPQQPPSPVRAAERDAPSGIRQISHRSGIRQISYGVAARAPLISITTRGDTAGEALRLADAANAALADRVAGLNAGTRAARDDRVTITVLNPPSGGAVAQRLRVVLAALAGLGVLLGGAALILLVPPTLGVVSRAVSSARGTGSETDPAREAARHRVQTAEAEPNLAGQPGPGGDWPRTTRVMPWALAGFLVLLWLVPFDAIGLPFSLPVDAKLDRVAMGGLFLLWLAVACAGWHHGVRWRPSAISAAIILFLTVAVLTVAFNASTLNSVGELALAVKKLTLAGAFAIFFYIVATTVRQRELGAYITLTVALACITAIGTIVEFRTGVNYFYDLSADVLPGSFSVGEPREDPAFGRVVVVGPTGQGLAVTTMLGMALPFAISRLWQTSELRQRLLYSAAVILLFAGAVSTVKKTGLVAPLAALLVMTLYQPRRMIRLLPLGVVLVVIVQAIAPGALGAIRSEFVNDDTKSTEARTNDYPAVSPDVESGAIIGRGFGTYDPRFYETNPAAQRHRLLDNQYLVLLIETGAIGIAAYLTVMLAGVGRVDRLARSRQPARAGPGAAIIGAIAAFAVTNALFDTLAFPQVPYLFLCLLGFAVVATAQPRLEPGDIEQSPDRSPSSKARGAPQAL